MTAARVKRGLTQAQLGEAAGLRQATVSAIESGDVRPRPETIKGLAEALGVSVEWLLGVPDAPERSK